MYDMQEISECCKAHTLEEVSRKYDCLLATVRNACETFEVRAVSKPQKDRKVIADWVRDNRATLKQAAERFKCSKTRVRSACLENGVEARVAINGPRPIGVSTLEVVAMLIRGYTYESIAEEFCMSKQRVHQISEAAKKAQLLGTHAIVNLRPGCEAK
jgi:hypothetical protein